MENQTAGSWIFAVVKVFNNGFIYEAHLYDWHKGCVSLSSCMYKTNYSCTGYQQSLEMYKMTPKTESPCLNSLKWSKTKKQNSK